MWETTLCLLPPDSFRFLEWQRAKKQVHSGLVICQSNNGNSFLLNRAPKRRLSRCRVNQRLDGVTDRCLLRASRQKLVVGIRSRESRLLQVRAAGDDMKTREEDAEMQTVEWLELDSVVWEGDGTVGLVDVQIEKTGVNSRKIVAKVLIEAPLEIVWAILTDYTHLSDFLPGLTVSKLVEKRDNGARLYQEAEKELALGVKFKAKALVECEEKPISVHRNFIRRDIDFETVEGDFQIFRGTWRMEQFSIPSYVSEFVEGGEKFKTYLSYIVLVQPKKWLPVALVEGMVANEIRTNLVCIRDKSLQPRVSS